MDNTSIFLTIFNLGHKSALLDNIMIFGAKYLIILTFFFIMALGLRGKAQERQTLMITLLSLPLSLIIIQIIHLFVHEPRPFITLLISPLISHTADYAFPSTHTTVMATIFFAFAFYKSKFTWLLLFLMLWVGFSRIFVGVHYPLDILGGIMVGFISVFLVWRFKHKLPKRFQNLIDS